MRILFNLINVGLGDNGGSSTLIKSANMIIKLGHKVIFIDSGKNQHTWTRLKAEHKIIKKTNNIPDADIVIATGFKSWDHTFKLPERCGTKVIWLRGWETWQAPENQLIYLLKNPSCFPIVNSEGLQNKLLKYKIKSKLIRPGNDFNGLYPLNIRGQEKIILGGLYHTKHNTKRSDWILQAAHILKKKFNNIQLHMFGTSPNPKLPIIDKYVQKPDLLNKNIFFNKIDIFLSPSKLEGLHIVPQEAMATGCPIVGTNAELSGTQDYLFHERNGLVAENNFESFLNYIILLIKDKQLRSNLGSHTVEDVKKLGNRRKNMRKMVIYLEGIR